MSDNPHSFRIISTRLRTRIAKMEASRNPEIRKDAVNNRWVIFSPARSRRPSDFKSKSNPTPPPSATQSACPFCAGHEHECAPEIFRFPPDSGADWKVRVIQNLYPAVSREIESEPAETEVGSGRVRITGFGFHDVVIESPAHPVHLPDLEAVEIGDVLLAYKKRILQLKCYESIKYVQVFTCPLLLVTLLIMCIHCYIVIIVEESLCFR